MSLKKLWSKAGSLRYLLAVLLIFLLSVLLTLKLHNGSRYHTGLYDDYSQQLVYGRMHQLQQGQSTPGGFLGTYSDIGGDNFTRSCFLDSTPVEAERYQVYAHQSGLQGWFFGKLNLLFRHFTEDGIVRETWLYNVNCIFFYAINLCIAWALMNTAGPLPALAWVLSLLISPWVQRGMKDLYWCLWLWLLPLGAGILFCALAKRTGKVKGSYYFLIGASCMIRCLCGFEFISTFLILMEIPMAYRFFEAGADKMCWLKRMWWAGVSGLTGVLTALAVWLIQGWLWFGSFQESLQNILYAMGSRMSISDGTVRPDASVFKVVYKYLVEEHTSVLQWGTIQITPLALLAGTALVICAGCILFAVAGKQEDFKWLLPWLAVWGLSLAAPVSWMVLSKAHSDIHTHLIPMLWYFSFVPASCTVITAVICRCIRTFQKQK